MTHACNPPSSTVHLLLRKRRGYVLVVTLGLLVLAASLMVAVSRGALRHATAARLAADELQQRWGTVSCRTATLPYAEVILGSAEADRKSPQPLYRTRIQLGDETFDLTIADEMAKADVNLLLDHTDRSTAENRLRQALAGTGLSSQIRLRPGGAPVPAPALATTKPATQSALPQLISGFGQIFTDASPEHLLIAQGGFRPADVLTCWSRGQINLRRVSPAALKIAGGQLTLIEQGRLLEARDNVFSARPKPLPNPEKGPVDSDPIRRALNAAKIDPKSLRGAPAFTGNSACYSLWITASDKRRTWHSFSVLDQSVKEQPRTAAFVW